LIIINAKHLSQFEAEQSQLV